MSDWISVIEYFPQDNHEVFVAKRCKDMREMCFDIAEFYLDGGWHNFMGGYDRDCEVTH